MSKHTKSQLIQCRHQREAWYITHLTIPCAAPAAGTLPASDAFTASTAAWAAVSSVADAVPVNHISSPAWRARGTISPFARSTRTVMPLSAVGAVPPPPAAAAAAALTGCQDVSSCEASGHEAQRVQGVGQATAARAGGK